jgi:hypothetical protein
MRRDPKARSAGIPSAINTSDGSGFPVLHAEPEEQAKPAMSSIISKLLPFIFSNTKLL